MFKVKNISNGKIILGDLKLTIDRDSEIDLDLLFSREKLEQSQTLHRCLQSDQKKLEIIHKDIITKLNKESISIIDEKIKQQVSERLSMVQMQKDNTENIDDLKKQLNLLIDLVKNQQTVIVQEKDTQMTKKSDVYNDSDIDSINIQEKVIKRLSKNVESQVETKKEINESDIKNKSNELEGLI